MISGSRVLISPPTGEVVSAQPAAVVSLIDSDTLSVMVEGGLEPQVVPTSRCHPLPTNWNTSVFSVTDLTQLPVPSPSSVFPLHALEQRYTHRGCMPYVHLGTSTLIYMNPFTRLSAPQAGAPSPQTLGRAALNRLLSGKNDDGTDIKRVGLAVTGVSGAGKTMALGFALEAVVERIKETAEAKGSLARLTKAAPALELFGNAATRHNANSSRFLKQVSLYLESDNDTHSLVGVSLSASLLELSRVVERASGEGPFHILRLMFTDLPSSEKRRLDLWDPTMFRLAHSPSNGGSLPPVPWSFGELQCSLRALGITQSEEGGLWSLLASVLHLGNVEFESTDDFAPVTIRNRECVARAAALLGLEGGSEALEAQLQTVQLGTVQRRLHREAATRVRDSLCRDLYGLAFNFIVARFNSSLEEQKEAVPLTAPTSPESGVPPMSPDTPKASGSALSLIERAMRGLKRAKAVSAEVGSSSADAANHTAVSDSNFKLFTPPSNAKELVLVDIFGFEDMLPAHTNSLEQLLINFTNEAFQSLYTSSALASQTDLLAAEGVPLPAQVAESNVAASARDIEVIKAFTSRSKPIGMLKLIADDASLAQQHANQGEVLVGKIVAALGPTRPGDPHVVSRPPILRGDEFLVNHYAGTVKYHAAAFATKDRINRAAFDSFMLRVPGQSFVGSVHRQVSTYIASLKDGRPHSDQQAGKSQSAQFQVYLEQIRASLGATDALFWVRCIKPNMDSDPGRFDGPYVSKQLAACGVYRAYLLAMAGFAHSLPHQDFAQDFLRSLTLCSSDQACRNIVDLLNRCRFHECCSQGVNLLPHLCGIDPSEVAVGSTRVFLMPKSFAALTLAAHKADDDAATVLGRVGRGCLARRSLVSSYRLLQKRRTEDVVRARLVSEEPIRAALERERAVLFQRDASFRDTVLVADILPSSVRARKVCDKLRRVVGTLQLELQRAFRELQGLEDSRIKAERDVRVELEERLKLAERRLDEKKRAAAQSTAFEERRHMRLQREAAAKERAAALKPLPPDREAAVLTKLKASQSMRMQGERDATMSFYEGLAAESDRTQVRIVSRHVGASVDQLVRSQRSRSAVGERTALSQEMLLDSAIRDSYRTMERVKQLHHGEYQRQRHQEDECRKGHYGHAHSMNTLTTRSDQFPLPLPSDIRLTKEDHFAVAARSHSARFKAAECQRDAKLDAHRGHLGVNGPLTAVSHAVCDVHDNAEHWEGIREAWALQEEHS